MRRILQSESLTIAGGTSAVQKNMIGERILQLPKG
jgi:alkylation response protein AidB-like acyl-CoA dehydrogenase